MNTNDKWNKRLNELGISLSPELQDVFIPEFSKLGKDPYSYNSLDEIKMDARFSGLGLVEDLIDWIGGQKNNLIITGAGLGMLAITPFISGIVGDKGGKVVRIVGTVGGIALMAYGSYNLVNNFLVHTCPSGEKWSSTENKCVPGVKNADIEYIRVVTT